MYSSITSSGVVFVRWIGSQGERPSTGSAGDQRRRLANLADDWRGEHRDDRQPRLLASDVAADVLVLLCLELRRRTSNIAKIAGMITQPANTNDYLDVPEMIMVVLSCPSRIDSFSYAYLTRTRSSLNKRRSSLRGIRIASSEHV